MRWNRRVVEAQPMRAAFAMRIAEAGASGGQFRVRGVMNSFSVMHSGRILHPAGYIEWMRNNPDATLPMLLNHGIGGDLRSAVIGKWDRFSGDAESGMVWEGFVGEGTQLCDESRTLLSQRLLSGLSMGWYTLTPPRWVNLKDADLDPFVKQAMDREGVDECYAFFRYEPVEGSIVDVPDDRNGRLAAGRGESGSVEVAAVMEQFRGEFREIVADHCRAFTNHLAEIVEEWRAANGDRLFADGLDYADEVLAEEGERRCSHSTESAGGRGGCSESAQALIDRWRGRTGGGSDRR